jgi:CheY-like chemotaxis protein
VIDELLSLRVILAAKALEDHDLFRRAAAAAPVPIDLEFADSGAAATNCVTAGADLVYLDNSLAPVEIAQVVAAARTTPNPPFTVLLATGNGDSPAFVTDALAGKPAGPEEATRLLARSIRVRLPSRVLVVDDSSTMRSIVRKLLAGTRLPLEVSEADEGFAALKQVGEADIDLVFLDYNMPGFSGLETLAELKREKRQVSVVVMSSANDESLPGRAREYGAAFLKKPFYSADIEAMLCRFYGLRALNPKRA